MRSPRTHRLPALLPALLIWTLSCGFDGAAKREASPADAGVQPADAGPPVPTDAPEAGVDLAALRRRVLAAIESSRCPGDPCPLVTVTPEPASATPASRGQRILLFDDAILTAAATRYRSRTLAYITSGPGGAYREFAPSVTIGRDAHEILRMVDEVPGEVASKDLDAAVPFLQKFGELIPGIDGHGADILPFLAERVPDAQFVIADDLRHLGPEVDCDMLVPARREAAFQAFSERVGALGESLVRVIERHGVNFLHLSWGFAHADLLDDFQRKCGKAAEAAEAARIMETYVGLFRRLTALVTPGAGGEPRPVLVFQAGKAVSRPDLDVLDCAEIAGRIRAYSLPYTGTAVPCSGSRDLSLLKPELRTRTGCLDIFMVMGYEGLLGPLRPGRYFPFAQLGLGEGLEPAWPPTPSFANPIALAHFLFLVQRRPEQTTAVWLRDFTQGGAKPIWDPLLHDTFPRALSGGRPPPCSGEAIPSGSQRP
jgi:hypothetical protein